MNAKTLVSTFSKASAKYEKLKKPMEMLRKNI